MKFDSLVIDNFLALKEARIELSDRGLVSIEGVNDDDSSAISNGAGKSSLADALCWCLYGVTARGVSGDAVVNNKTKKDTRVSLRIIDGDKEYYIKRYRKHKTFKNLLSVEMTTPDGMRDVTAGTDKITQGLVEEIIGCSYEVFRASIYAGQEQMPDLPGLTDKQLKLLIEEAAGVTILEKAYEEARARVSVQTKTAEETTSRFVQAKARADEIAVDLASSMSAQKGFAKGQAEKLGDIVNKVKDLNTSYADCMKTLKKEPKSEIMERIKAIDYQFAEIDNERQEERRLEEHSQTTFATCRSLTGASSVIKNQITSAQYDLDRVNERIGTPCGECGKTYCEDDLAEAKKLAAKKLAKLNVDLDTLEIQQGIALETHKSAQSALETFRATMSDASALSAERVSLSDRLACIRDGENQARAILDKIKALKDNAKTIATEVNPYDKMVEDWQQRLNDTNTKMSVLEVASAEQAKELRISNILVKVFAPAGVRAHILDTVTPFLNAQTSKYLSVLSDGNIQATWSTLVTTTKGELREKFSIEVKNSKGGTSFGLISGGEKRKVRIACALALQDLVASRATKPIELFIGDEIDDALDAAGLERLMMILQEKALERGSVFVISHNSGIRDWISNTITVVRKDGVSTLMEAA
jgi:DNA repair exonuclease SbcCD ATPase subunit